MKKALKILVTNDCNSRCSMCSIWKSSIKNYINPYKLLKSIDIEINSVIISGGEPTLMPGLKNFIEDLPCENFLINTNGTNPDIILDIINNTNKKIVVGVSIDGMELNHNKQRGIDCFNKSINLIKCLKAKNVNTIISNTITPANISDILYVYKLAKSLKCGFSTRPAHSNSYYSQKTKFDQHDIESIRTELKRIKSVWSESYLTTYFTQHIPDYLEGKISAPICHESERSIWIDETGNIFPCHNFKDMSIGNVYQNTISEILYSNNYKTVINKISSCSHCWNDCAVIGNLAKTHHGTINTLLSPINYIKRRVVFNNGD